jgi:hypothetical protein
MERRKSFPSNVLKSFSFYSDLHLHLHFQNSWITKKLQVNQYFFSNHAQSIQFVKKSLGFIAATFFITSKKIYQLVCHELLIIDVNHLLNGLFSVLELVKLSTKKYFNLIAFRLLMRMSSFWWNTKISSIQICKINCHKTKTHSLQLIWVVLSRKKLYFFCKIIAASFGNG